MTMTRKTEPDSPLDPISVRIIEQMQENSDIGLAELAEATGTTPSSCWRRLDELRARGVIRRSVAVVDPAAIGLAVNVFVQVTLEKQTQAALQAFDEAVRGRPEVMECYLMSGDSDYLIRVALPDIAALERFILEQLTPIPGIEKIRSSFALKQVRYKTALPLPHARG